MLFGMEIMQCIRYDINVRVMYCLEDAQTDSEACFC